VRLARLLQILTERGSAVLIEQSAQFHVGAPTFGKIISIGLAERADSRVAMLVADFAVGVTVPGIKAGLGVSGGHGCSFIGR